MSGLLALRHLNMTGCGRVQGDALTALANLTALRQVLSLGCIALLWSEWRLLRNCSANKLQAFAWAVCVTQSNWHINTDNNENAFVLHEQPYGLLCINVHPDRCQGISCSHCLLLTDYCIHHVRSEECF